MKKIIGVALIGAVVALAPVGASASSHCKKGKACHKHDAHEEVIGVGAGALAGAAVGGPVGAVVGGLAGLFIVKHAE